MYLYFPSVITPSFTRYFNLSQSQQIDLVNDLLRGNHLDAINFEQIVTKQELYRRLLLSKAQSRYSPMGRKLRKTGGRKGINTAYI